MVVKCFEDAGVNAVEPIGPDVEAVGGADDLDFFFFSCFGNDFSNRAETSVCFVSGGGRGGVPDNEADDVVDTVGADVVINIGDVEDDSIVVDIGGAVVDGASAGASDAGDVSNVGVDSIVVDVGDVSNVGVVVDSVVVIIDAGSSVAGGVSNADGSGSDAGGSSGSGDVDGASLTTSDVFGIIGPGTGPEGFGGIEVPGEVLGIIGIFPVIIEVINLFKTFLLFAK